ncbi:MAG: hypothetical protein PHO27_06460 [Sulfuricurvum sp.]|nr:hypothetical protein [Sulfuricurvum sp.]
MKKIIALALAVFLIGGCAPKIGEDIFIEPQGNVHLENSGSEVMLGLLSLMGVSVGKTEIRIGGDLKVTNRWHSDIKVVSLTYSLNDENELIANGEVKNYQNPIVITAGEGKIIPLVLRIDPERLNANRLLGLIQSKHKWFVKGEAVIEVWGFQKHYRFEKEMTKIMQKALKDGV